MAAVAAVPAPLPGPLRRRPLARERRLLHRQILAWPRLSHQWRRSPLALASWRPLVLPAAKPRCGSRAPHPRRQPRQRCGLNRQCQSGGNGHRAVWPSSWNAPAHGLCRTEALSRRRPGTKQRAGLTPPRPHPAAQRVNQRGYPRPRHHGPSSAGRRRSKLKLRQRATSKRRGKAPHQRAPCPFESFPLLLHHHHRSMIHGQSPWKCQGTSHSCSPCTAREATTQLPKCQLSDLVLQAPRGRLRRPHCLTMRPLPSASRSSSSRSSQACGGDCPAAWFTTRAFPPWTC